MFTFLIGSGCDQGLCKCSQGVLCSPPSLGQDVIRACVNAVKEPGRDVIRACVNAVKEPCVHLPN